MIPKFRAFNQKTQKMYGVDGFKSSERKIYRCSLADDEFRSGRLETFHFVEDNLDDYILRQSTGLFDKNGVEIFEGDVVEYDDGEYLFAGKVVKTVFGTYVKSYSFFSFEDFSDENTMTADVEIIGNIYEESVEE
ncbi:TPA: YopX family protein [Streptococcus pyogenes]|uniref:YopX family protein n=1 Tax=Streptococcus pyogenes TaxID=1314 RepID=UPI00109C3009|nr:YopX family protein [Streptococcus pyogenes]VGZ28984.1 phage protein [Streptococcus pyogenes]VHA12246.1 phage protein [Streptococcus pyogenes]VHE55962.1 phage protein [Streptococcus pyogenes]VHG78541.1 phage protein [Streptococcus pyogenes]VHN01897.1 phage protein [Streptococcus pyogenes]